MDLHCPYLTSTIISFGFQESLISRSSFFAPFERCCAKINGPVIYETTFLQMRIFRLSQSSGFAGNPHDLNYSKVIIERIIFKMFVSNALC